MPKILDQKQIENLLADIDVLPLIEEGFAAYSQGRCVVPPVGELELEKGEVHLKYGFIREQPYYVIKIASGFYGNTQLGLSTSNGCMLAFSQATGEMEGILLDEGYLTDVRTAVAGAIAAKHIAPNEVKRIGIVGTGIQARLQLLHLQPIVNCRDVLVWGRSQTSTEKFAKQLEEDKSSGLHAYDISVTSDLAEVQQTCRLIVSTTPARTPLLKEENLIPGTHITAVGSDMPEKQELESEILARADFVVADSIEQCLIRGEISQALRSGNIKESDIVELGNIISGKHPGRTSSDQTTIADLTGVAVQDIQIASAVLTHFE